MGSHCGHACFVEAKINIRAATGRSVAITHDRAAANLTNITRIDSVRVRMRRSTVVAEFMGGHSEVPVAKCRFGGADKGTKQVTSHAVCMVAAGCIEPRNTAVWEIDASGQ